MTRHEKRAGELFTEGYNCAQSVFAAFAEDLGMDEKAALRLSSAFGGGIGRLREVCGAASGMAMVLGAIEGYDVPDDGEGKKAYYARVQALMGTFKDEFGSYICRELLDVPGPEGPTPEKRDAKYDRERPCRRCVEFAARLADERILKCE
jgi:C_GCAxxG_C_C family probable redox protein